MFIVEQSLSRLEIKVDPLDSYLIFPTLCLDHQAVLVTLAGRPAGLQHEGVHPGADLAGGDAHLLGHAAPQVYSSDGIYKTFIINTFLIQISIQLTHNLLILWIFPESESVPLQHHPPPVPGSKPGHVVKHCQETTICNLRK